jgi:hypothetical protein
MSPIFGVAQFNDGPVKFTIGNPVLIYIKELALPCTASPGSPPGAQKPGHNETVLAPAQSGNKSRPMIQTGQRCHSVSSRIRTIAGTGLFMIPRLYGKPGQWFNSIWLLREIERV